MKKKKLIYTVLGIMVLSLVGVSLFYWYQNKHYVVTEDARVAATIYKAGPRIAGKILECNVEEGDAVRQGQIIARLDDVTLPPGSNLELTVVRAPISGIVLKKLGYAGEIGAPGQPVAMIADLKDLYISANIEEDELHKLKMGQFVEFTVDSVPGHTFTGKITSLGEASASTFSLLPQQNTGGSFTKVVQRIPIDISIDDYQGQRLLPGINSVVKIHLQ